MSTENPTIGELTAVTPALNSKIEVEQTPAASGHVTLTQVKALVSDVSAGTDLELVRTNSAGNAFSRAGHTIATLLTAARDRATHSGTQLAATISDFASAVGALLTWANISGKPTEFPPDSHTQALSTLTQSGATTGQVARWNGTAWAPATPSSGGSPIETAGPLVVRSTATPVFEPDVLQEFYLGANLICSMASRYNRGQWIGALAGGYQLQICAENSAFPNAEFRGGNCNFAGRISLYGAGMAYQDVYTPNAAIEGVDAGSSNGRLAIYTMRAGTMVRHFDIERAAFSGASGQLFLTDPASSHKLYRLQAIDYQPPPDTTGLANVAMLWPSTAYRKTSGTELAMPGGTAARIGPWEQAAAVNRPQISPAGRMIVLTSNARRADSGTLTMAGSSLTVAILIRRRDLSLGLVLQCTQSASSTAGTWDLSVNNSGDVRFGAFLTGFTPIAVSSAVDAYTALIVRIESGQPTSYWVNGTKTTSSTPTGSFINDTVNLGHRPGAGFSASTEIIGFITTTAISDAQAEAFSTYLMAQAED
jgi:hypothetical protein